MLVGRVEPMRTIGEITAFGVVRGCFRGGQVFGACCATLAGQFEKVRAHGVQAVVR